MVVVLDDGINQRVDEMIQARRSNELQNFCRRYNAQRLAEGWYWIAIALRLRLRLHCDCVAIKVATAVVIAIVTAVASAAGPSPIPVTDKSFGCISHLKPVRGFFVGSLTGNLAATLKVARSPNGGVYPAGSVIKLVPTEVMVKQPKGFNEITHDWEFFELNASKEGTSINKRGFAEVVNRFGGNCFGCHIKAEPKWDFVCETGHGCDPIPLTEPMLKALQHTDPRCTGSDNVSAEDAAALKQIQELTHPKKPADPKSG